MLQPNWLVVIQSHDQHCNQNYREKPKILLLHRCNIMNIAPQHCTVDCMPENQKKNKKYSAIKILYNNKVTFFNILKFCKNKSKKTCLNV